MPRIHTLRAWRLLSAVLAASHAFSACAAPIAVGGFNDDVVTENAPTHFGHRFGWYNPYPVDWAENGLSDNVSTAVGLPTSHTFASATNSGANYVLQDYTANNVLRMGDGDASSGTMFVVPDKYAALHILAATATD